jgi:hypothetical protein
MAMPKTTPDLDGFSSAGKHNVWSAGQILFVQPESVAQLVEHTPDHEFWLSIGGSISLHVPSTTDRNIRELSLRPDHLTRSDSTFGET